LRWYSGSFTGRNNQRRKEGAGDDGEGRSAGDGIAEAQQIRVKALANS